MSDATAGILSTIDGALRDYALSGDAMRWAPPGTPASQLPARPAAITVEFDTGPFMAALADAAAAAGRLIAGMARALKPLAAVAATITEADASHRAQMRAMHVEYARRRKARTRRKRGR